MRILDFMGMLCSLTVTYFFIQSNIKVWSLSLISISLNAVLYYLNGLYATFMLEMVYAVMTLYGWQYWSSSASDRVVLDESFERFVSMFWLTATLLVWLYVRYVVQLNTILALDFMAVSICLLAQWLTCRRVLLCWVMWFIADAVHLVVMVYKGIYFHTILYTLYLGLACVGYWQWRQFTEVSTSRLSINI